jgi:hypothetical protein
MAYINPSLVTWCHHVCSKTAALCRTGVWEWQRPWLQIFGSTDFYFFGSSSVELSFLSFLDFIKAGAAGRYKTLFFGFFSGLFSCFLAAAA